MFARIARRAGSIIAIIAATLVSGATPSVAFNIANSDALPAFVRSSELPLFAVALPDGSDIRTIGLSAPFSPSAPGSDHEDPFNRSRPRSDYLSPKGIFGSVEIPLKNFVHAQRWQDLLAENASRYFGENCDGPARLCNSHLRRTIASAVSAARLVGDRERLEIVNTAVNRAIRWQSDAVRHGVPDYWATVSETLASGAGDCEDIAIVKFWALQAAGVPADAIRLVLLKERVRKLDHAVIAVRLDDDNLILDSLVKKITKDTQLEAYVPMISVASEGTWIHGFARRTYQVASAQRDRYYD